jgi:predicted nucleic acid-binding protein
MRSDGLLVECQADRMSLSISRINVGEIFYIIARDYGRGHATAIVQQLSLVSLRIVSVTDQHVDTAADLKSRYRISYADAFAASLAIAKQVPLVTGDPEFRALEKDGIVTLSWIGA